jgi:valyl-tRNA synthetase
LGTKFPSGGSQLGNLVPKLREEFDTLAEDVTSDMENFRYHLAAEKLYSYIWHRFADQILEESKKDPSLLPTTYYLLRNCLKLLHPFMPFITEEIWSSFVKATDGQAGLLMIEKWPQSNA